MNNTWKIIMVLAFTAILALLFYCFIPKLNITSNPIVIIYPNSVSPTNNYQFLTHFWMGTYKDHLYIIPKIYKPPMCMRKYIGSLCTVEDGKIVKKLDLITNFKPNYKILWFDDNRLYFQSASPPDDWYASYGEPYALEYISFPEMGRKELFSSSNIPDYVGFTPFVQYSDLDSLYFRSISYQPAYFHVRGDELIGVYDETPKGYLCGDYRYSYYEEDIEGGGSPRIIRTNSSGEKELLKTGRGDNSLIPLQHGILVHVRDSYKGEGLLYYITEEGGLIELFSVPHLQAYSAVTVHGTDVYISFWRFVKFHNGDIDSLERDENDELEGTYRISLHDYSMEKISDQIFNGMFVFDDTGIYACDEYNIYKLDFDGNILDTLLKIGR